MNYKEIKMPKYPNIKVKLVGLDGNAFFIIGRCVMAMKKGGLPKSEQDEFYKQATSGSYNDLLATCIQWFDIY